MSESADVLVLGGGPAGLATAACLKRAGRPAVVVEKGERPGESWHNHYARLHLHTVRESSHLPFVPFPARWPRYVPRGLVADYLVDYARTMEIAPRLGVAALAVEKRGSGWRTRLSDGGVVDSAHVVVATGFNRVPLRPTWDGEAGFAGTIEHSRAYRSGEPHRGKDVLVVGMGNTGAEIALDLLEHGARPAISIRGPVNIVPRDFLGRSTQKTAALAAKLPDWIADTLGRALRRVAVGNLEKWGIETPSEPPAAQLRRHGKTPVIDVGTLAEIKKGTIGVRPDVARFDRDAVIFVDARRERFDHVVVATGYRPGIVDFLSAAAPLLDDRGAPRTLSATGDLAGLHFVGFDGYSVGGLLATIRRDAQKVAETIAASG